MRNQIKKSYTQNREISWLKFNERVLEEAADTRLPLLERFKFISIFTSNLDEFFMIRVGSLFDMAHADNNHIDNKSGMTPKEQLDAVYAAVRPLYEKKKEIYKELKPAFEKRDIYSLDFDDLTDDEHKFTKEYYEEFVKPILSPQIVDTHHPFPHIPNKEVYVIAMLKQKQKGVSVLGLIPVPPSLPPTLYFPGNKLRYMRMEKLIYHYAQDAFGSYEVVNKNCICVTRNADIHPDDESFEDVDDFRSTMKKLLHKRKRLSVVRLEATYPMNEKFESILCEKFKITKHQIFESHLAMKMGYVYDLDVDLLEEPQKKSLSFDEYVPVKTVSIDHNQSIISQIQKKDLLLFYPYESMDTFLQLIKESAHDSSVVSIKITIYRLAKKTKLVEYLCAAAENGKEVTVLLELRARFDEQNNIDWSERLEEAGCKIIYGLDQYKVHSKVCLITRKDRSGFSYITQIGTGNYNESTAKTYTDFSLMTANRSIATDALEFFKNISIGNIEGEYRSLLVAPNDMKRRFLLLIDDEIAKGDKGQIFIKVNSITDIDFIDKLAEASKAGVTVKLIVRGICCLLPKVAGETDNITVISIIGRYLEHTRVYSFGEGATQKLFIASADMMTRNMERRIEVAAPILDDDIKEQINKIMDIHWFDNVKARILTNDGDYVKKIDNRDEINSQTYFQKYYTNLSNTVKEEPKKVSFLQKLFGKK